MVRCIDTAGELLQEIETDEVVNREVKKTAPEIEGYVLTGEPEKTIIITRDPSRNVYLFVYEPAEPVDEEDPDDLGLSKLEDPDGTGDDYPYDPNPYDPGPYDPGPYYPPDPGDIVDGQDPYDPNPYDPGPYDPGPYYPPDPGDIVDGQDPYDPNPYDPGPYYPPDPGDTIDDGGEPATWPP